MSATAFHKKMLKCLAEYNKALSLSKPNKSLVHYYIIHTFLNYINNLHLVAEVDQITVSMANSKFYYFYTQKKKGAFRKIQ